MSVLYSIYFPSTVKFMKKGFLGKFCDTAQVFFMYDRFGYLNQFSEYSYDENLHEDLPSPRNHDLEEILDEEISRVLSKDKDIYLSWSGGVDSTLLACVLIKNMKDFSRLHVLHSSGSVVEYPKFYAYMRDALKLDMVPLRSDPGTTVGPILKDEGNLLVSGWYGDQLVGSVVNNHHQSLWDKDWKSALRYLKYSSRQMEQAEAAVSHYGLPIEKTQELFWWMNFSCKWDMLKNFVVFNGSEDLERVEMPFSSRKMQEWAMFNFDKIAGRNPFSGKTYKPEYKKIIQKIYKDDDYLNAKGKVPSWRGANVAASSQGYGRAVVHDSEGYSLFKIRTTDNRNVLINNILNKYKKNPEYVEYFKS